MAISVTEQQQHQIQSIAVASTNVILRMGKPEDAESCGVICFEAFKTISDHHKFPRDFPAPNRRSVF